MEDAHDTLILQARGLPAQARVLDAWLTPGGRGGPGHDAAIVFAAPPRLAPVIDVLSLHGRDVRAAVAGRAVPVLYDPEAPARAALNVSDGLRRAHPRWEAAGWMAMLAVMAAALWAGFAMQVRDAVAAHRLIQRG